MAPVTPAQIFPGYTSDGTVITIPIADLDGLTPAEADAATGNAMELLRMIIEKAQTQLNAMATTARPARATLTKDPVAIAAGTGVAPGTLRQGYRLTFDLTPTSLEPAPE
jgi:hypothetical protein